MSNHLPWQLSGTYLESCNCEAICPCRTIGDRKGGRSTYGICLGALSWAIERGRAGELNLSGFHVVLTSRYDDDEPGSPWSFYLYLDERGDERQREALAEIFLGRLGGTPLKQFSVGVEAKRLARRPGGANRDRPHTGARVVSRRPPGHGPHP